MMLFERDSFKFCSDIFLAKFIGKLSIHTGLDLVMKKIDIRRMALICGSSFSLPRLVTRAEIELFAVSKQCGPSSFLV